MSARRRRPALIDLASGFALWALAFATLYAMLSLGCRFGWDRVEVAAGVSLQRIQLLLILVMFVVAQARLLLRIASSADETPTAGFLRAAGRCAAVAAIAASLFTFAAVFVLQPCA